MENGSQGMTTRSGGNAGALSFDMLSTGPTAPVASAAVTPPASQLNPIVISTSPPQAPQTPPAPRKKRPTKLLLVGGIILLALIFIGGLLFLLHAFQNNSGEKQNIGSQFSNVDIPLDQLVNQPGINVLGARSLVINGQLRTNDSLIVSPSGAPKTPTAGQIYYDKNSNQLGYYNGSQFIYVTSAKTTVDSLGGATGAIATGTGLQLVGSTLNNSGVLSFQGQSGAVTLTAGSGISVDGTTITNTGDSTVGNEVSDVVSGTGLLRVGSGTTLDPYKVALQACASGELLKSSGSGTWACGIDNGTTQTAGNGLQLVGNQFSVNSPTCSGTDKLSWDGTAFICSADLGGTAYSAGTGLNLVSGTFNNTGTLSVTASGALTSTGGQNPNIAFANGGVAGQFWQWNGSAWALATMPIDGDSVTGNEVTDVTGINSGLIRSGSGTSGSPYTLAVNASNGLQLSGGAVVINSPTCSGTDKLTWNGSAFVCSTDVDTNTTYAAGSGLSLVGTTFNNTGTLSVGGSGAISVSGGQNATVAFANGSSVGQFWQWNGTTWVLASLPGEGDAVVGNEVTDVTGINSGLTRSGSGTSGSPYTLAVNPGNGLQLSGGAVSILSATCSGTDKLQWTGIGFICSADVDTNTTYSTITNGGLRLAGTNFGLQICASGQILQAQAVSGEWACISPSSVGVSYTAGNGLGLAGTQFSVNSPTCSGTDKLQWTGTAFQCSNDVDTDAQTLSWVNGTRTLSISNGNSVVIPDSDTTYTAAANGGLSLIGTQFTLSTCANGEIMKAQATSGQWACAADNSASYSAGTGLSLVGNTFSNSGILSVTGSGAITATAGQNPTVAFANGTANGQFWQWNGTSWVLATLPVDGDTVTGNEVTNVTGLNSGLARSGSGTNVSPYTLGLMTCANTEILQSSGSGNWACAAPTGVGTSYNIITNGGLRLAGSNFGLKVCTAGQLLQAQATSGEWDCVSSTGVGTSYVAGTGINITGSTITNTGVISVVGSGPITSSGGQNPSIDFVAGTANGQFWQWNGTSWVLATLPGEGDGIVGNEVTDVTGANSGLLRSGSGTTISPYTLAVNAGSGLQLSAGAVLINSPTCSGTDKLQWTGTAFICSTDVDTNTTYNTIANGGLRLSGTNFGLSICANGEILQAQVTSGQWACVAPNTVGAAYTAGNGLGLSGTQFSVNSPTCTGTDKLQWTGTAFICSADVNTDAQTLTWVSGTRTLSISGGNSVVIPDSDTTYTAAANGGLTLVGTQFALGTCTVNQVMKAQATSGQWACAADDNTTYTAGTGMSLVGTTFNNSGILTVAGSGAISVSGGQNATVAFANGSSNGQFWQWNGTAWVLATDGDSVTGNEVTDVTGINSGLTRSGSGTNVSPYTLAVNTGSGLQLSGGAVLVSSPTCSGTDKLQWNGTAFLCSTDVDTNTTYGTIANGGLQLSGTNFGLQICANGQLLQAQVTSGQWACVNANTVGAAYTAGNGLSLATTQFSINSPTCAGTTKLQWNGTAFVCSTDVDTTYAAGTGLSLVGTTFSNSGILSLTGGSNISITGGQNATVGFVNGSSAGQVWQWNGSAWVLATVSGGTLQSDYTASTGGTTPEIKLDSTRGALDIQDANTTIGSNLLNVRASASSGLGNILFSIGNTGAITVQNSTDSSSAFQILNSTGGNLMTVDSTGSNIALLSNNSSTLSTWNTTTAMSVGASTVRVRGGAIVANGYLYYIGGNDNNSGNTISTVEYAKVNTDGTVGTWASTTSLNDGANAPRRQFKPVVANGFLYVIGGRDASNNTKNTVMYAKLNTDGTLGSWKTTTVLPSARLSAGTFAYNGYMYVVGGFDSSVNQTNTIYYSKINPDGTLGSWTTNATNINDSIGGIEGTTVANGYVYIPGGYSTASGGTSNDLRYAKLNADGSIGSWTTQGAQLGGSGDDDFMSYVANGYLYVVGGDNSWSSPRVEALQLNANGSTGSPITLPNFPQAMVGEAAMAQANGYFYALGGSSVADGGGTVRNSVYYASTPRVKVGGNLDLVSFSGENLAEDGASGQLTAGNTIVTGTLQVQDVASFVRSVSIGDSLRVGGMATVSADSSTAFQVQKADGTPLLTADTTNSRFYIGPVAGNTTGALVVLGNKTNTGDPTGVEGAMYYNSASKQFRCYRDTSWEACGINPVDRGFTVTDEFLGGCNNNINNNHYFGELGWSVQAIGANGSSNCNPSNPTPSADHPGVFYLTTTTVANQGTTLTLGNSNSGSVVVGSNYTIKQTLAADSNTGIVMRSGLHNETTATTQPTSGVWWEADPATNANWRYCYGNGTTATCANTSVAITANAWVRLEIRVTAVGSGTSAATFIINGTSASVSGVTIDSTNRVYPANTCYTTAAVARQCSYDYFQLQGIASAAR